MTKPAIVDKTDLLESLLAERILVLDGAMGTQIQALGSTSGRFAASDLPTITRTSRTSPTFSA